MGYTIYIDVLFCVNFIVDYMILLSVKHFRHLHIPSFRLLCGALVGGIGSLAILLPPMPFYLSWTVNILEALAMTAAAFCPVSIRGFLKTAVSMFTVSFFYCGAMTAVLALFSPKNVIIRNSTVYIGISPVMLVGLTLAVYLFMKLAWRLFGKQSAQKIVCDIEICHHGKILSLKGTVDTGNTLHEPFSGDCVIVGKADLFKDMVDIENYMDIGKDMTGIRLIPFKSVGGNGLMPAFRPSKIYLKHNAKKTELKAYLGLCRSENMTEENDLLVPSELVMKGS